VSSFGAVKRALAAAATVAAVLALSSCDAVEDTKTAATVGSSEVTVDEFQELITVLATPDGLIDPATDTVDGEPARRLLGAMVMARANEQFLAANGEQITEADRQSALAAVTLPANAPDDVIKLIGEVQAAATAQQRVAVPTADEVQQRYNESPIELGLVCVRQVVLPTEDAADDVVDELADGATFADVVNRSVDAKSKATGGEVQAPDGGPCLPVPDAAPILGSDVVLALTDAVPGDIVGPVQGAGGWHVVEVRPYEEVADAANGLIEQFGGRLLFRGFLVQTDVQVDPRYGRWDGAQATVITL
jgi:parvulin-like peptidyl-prolyl isomerase